MIITKTLFRRFSLPSFSLFLLLIAFCAGCRAAPTIPSQPQPGAGTPTAGPINLTLWHSETGTARTELEALAREFHSAYPNLTITPQYVGSDDDLAKQVTAAVAIGHMPDLVLARRGDVAQFARQGGLMSLDQFRSDPSVGFSPDDMADLFPGILEEGSFAEFPNQLYSVPFNAEGMVLFYNADSFTAASFAKPPSTWDEFADMASKLTVDPQYGWAMQIDADVFSGMLVSRGSALLDNPERRALFAERGGIASMTMASQLAKSGAAQAKSDRALALADFASGTAALYIDWLSELPVISRAQKQAGANFAIGVANLPQGDPSQAYIFERGADFAIFKTRPERESNAWFFVRWITATRQTAKWASAVGAIPLRASALPIVASGSPHDERISQVESSFGGVVPQFVPQSANRHIDAIDSLVEDAWTKIMFSKADIIPTLTNAATGADQILGAR